MMMWEFEMIMKECIELDMYTCTFCYVHSMLTTFFGVVYSHWCVRERRMQCGSKVAAALTHKSNFLSVNVGKVGASSDVNCQPLTELPAGHPEFRRR